MIDAYIWIGVWVVILIICIVELGKIENRMAEDEINKMFEYLKKRKKERLAMPRCIDADELKKCSFVIAYKDERNITQYGEFVEVVQCKDCKHCEWYIRAYYKNGIEVESHECRKYKMAVTRDWFCADGERKE